MLMIIIVIVKTISGQMTVVERRVDVRKTILSKKITQFSYIEKYVDFNEYSATTVDLLLLFFDFKSFRVSYELFLRLIGVRGSSSSILLELFVFYRQILLPKSMQLKIFKRLHVRHPVALAN